MIAKIISCDPQIIERQCQILLLKLYLFDLVDASGAVIHV